MRALMIALLLFCANGLHATDVSGVISSDVTWTELDSPYVITGDIDVRASLRINPGVRILFAAQKNLIVRAQGTIYALGTETQPIVMTSVRDNAGGTPSAGDWGYLHIVGGANSVASELRYVQLRFGKALKLEQASPNLVACRFEALLEAAITMDLQSSPRGAALSASGNGVNGILVPAGVITDKVQWSIQSLPYVVRGGLLHVGAKPPALKFERSAVSIPPSGSGSVRLVLADPAPSELIVALASANPTIASVPASVTILQDQYSAPVPITTFAPGEVQLTATAAGMPVASLSVTVTPLPSLAFFEPNISIGLNRTRRFGLSLNAPAPLAGLNVQLSADPAEKISVPGDLVLPSGLTTSSFNIDGLQLGSSLLQASGKGYAGASAQIEVIPLSMSFAQPVIVPIGSRDIQLRLSHAALPSGGVVTLTSSDPKILSVPATATFPGESSLARVTMKGLQEGTATVTASNPEYGQSSTLVRVEKIVAQFVSAPRRIPIGMKEQYSVALSGPAPNEGLTLQVASSNPSAVSVTPATVVFAPRQFISGAQVTIEVHAEGTALVTASSESVQRAELPVDAVARGRFLFNETEMTIGRRSQSRKPTVGIFADGQFYVPQQPLAVTFSVSDPSKVAAVLYNDGLRRNDPVQLTGLALTETPVTVQANYPEVLPALVPISVSVVEPIVQFKNLDGVRGLAGSRDDFYLTWMVPNSNDLAQTPVAEESLTLSLMDASPPSIIDGFYGASSGSTLSANMTFSPASNISVTRFVGAPTALGSYKVRALSSTLGTFDSEVQSVQGFNLAFSQADVSLGKGLRTGLGAITVQRRVGSTPLALSIPLTVTLINADPSRVEAPTEVIIPALASAASVALTGLELSQSVALRASAPAYGTSAPMTIRVLDPSVQIVPSSSHLTTDSPRTTVLYRVGVPPALAGTNPIAQLPSANLSIGIGTQDLVPAGIVGGMFDSFAGGAAINSVSVLPGSSEISAFLGQPTSAGSLKLVASIAGNASSPWVSETLTVVQNRLRIQDDALTVVPGLKGVVDVRAIGALGQAVDVALACNNSSRCTVTPASQTLGISSLQMQADLLGVAPGATNFTLQTDPSSYGDQSVPVQVVPLKMEFEDNGPLPNSGDPFGGWNARFIEGNVAPQLLTAQIELVDQSPAKVASLSNEPLLIDINAEEDETAPNGYNGFVVNYNTVGTFRFRVSIPGVGVYTTQPISTLKFERRSCRVRVGSGFKVPVSVQSTVAPNAPIQLNASCGPLGACAVIGSATLDIGSTSAEIEVRGGSLLGAAALNFSAPELGAIDYELEVIASDFSVGTFAASVPVGMDAMGNIALYIGAGGSSDCLFQEQRAALPIEFQLSSSNPAILSVPASALINVDTGSVSFPLSALSPGSATISVEFPGVGVRSFDVTVTP